MYFSAATALLFAASGASAALVLADLAASPDLLKRDVAQGWSLQSSSSLPDLHSCGNGAYCPLTLHCNPMVNNHQVAACCSGTGDCRGEVEGAPVCADSAWSLWVGYDGNGFCCDPSQVGAYDITKSVAGVCVAPGQVGSLRNAVLTSSGTGAAATVVPMSTSLSPAAPTSTSTSASSKSSSTTTAAAVVVAPTSSSASSAADASSTTATRASASSSSKSSSSAAAESSSSAGTANASSAAGNGTTTGGDNHSGAAPQWSMGAGVIVAALLGVLAL